MAFLAWLADAVLLVCFIFLVVKAFEDDTIEGMLVLLLPFYFLFYAFARFKGERKVLIRSLLVLSLLGPVLHIAVPLITARYDPCHFVTESEVEATLNEPVGEPERQEQRTPLGAGKVCRYRTVKEPPMEVLVTLVRNCQSLAAARGRADELVPGLQELGDDALWDGSSLLVRQGNTCFVLRLEEENPESGSNGSRPLEVSKALARKAISKVR